jgi:hypothetical protein
MPTPPTGRRLGPTRAARALAAGGLALALAHPVHGRAKPVESTPVAVAAAQATHILVAEVVGDTLTALKPGERVKALHPDDIWEEFRILRVVRGGGPGLHPGEVLRLQAKSNSCIVNPSGELVRLPGNGGVEFRAPQVTGHRPVTSAHPAGMTVVLFLDSERWHVGWFVSPSPLTPALEASLSSWSRPPGGS